MDFDKLDKRALTQRIIYGDDLQELYEIDVFLERLKSRKFRELEQENDGEVKLTIKSDLAWADNLLDICKKREYDLRENNNLFNQRFRINAEKILTPALYNRVAEASKKKNG